MCAHGLLVLLKRMVNLFTESTGSTTCELRISPRLTALSKSIMQDKGVIQLWRQASCCWSPAAPHRDTQSLVMYRHCLLRET